MSYYDRLIQQGEEKGRAQGRVEGRAEGKAEGRVEGVLEGRREVVLKQLALKFGALDERARTLVANATLDELDAMIERILTAATIDDVLG